MQNPRQAGEAVAPGSEFFATVMRRKAVIFSVVTFSERPASMNKSLQRFRSGVVALLVVNSVAVASNADWDVNDTGQPFKEVNFTTTEGTWMSVDVSPDGRQLVFDLLGDIYSLPAAGGDAQLLHGGPAMQRTPRFSHDGAKLLYLSDASGADNVWMSNVDGSGPQQITHETVDLLMSPGWGPAGSVVAARIEAAYPKRYTSEIRLFDLAGGSRVVVAAPANKRDASEPVVSRDGRYVYYTERLNVPNIYIDANHMNYAIKRRDLQDGVSETIAAGFGGALTPQVSNDGRRLAFVRRVLDKTVLFDLNLATEQQRPMYDALDRDLQAAFEVQGNYYPHFSWFPDNRHVAIWGKGTLFKVDMDSGAVTPIPFRVAASHRVTDPVRFVHDMAPAKVTARAVRNLAVSPDGRTMVFAALGQVWRKTLPQGEPVRLTKDAAVSFDPAYSSDGRNIVFVAWDDEKGSALLMVGANGGALKTIATSRGVIRQPRLSADGTRITYRIQFVDAMMGGARAKPGIYWVSTRGGESHFVTDGDEVPQFSPDGRRIYFVRYDRAPGSSARILSSVTVDGVDARDHALTPNADTNELRISPDLQWLAFRERQQYYVLRYRENGAPLLVSSATQEAPVYKLTQTGGYALSWSTDSTTLHWALGPDLYRTTVATPTAPPASAHASVGLEVPGDMPQGTVAFTNARIITMRDSEVIERGTVVVTGNRIRAVGESAQVAIPAGAKVIDATGKTLMPGLIDAHGHIDCCFRKGVSPQKQASHYAALAFGVTTNFDPYPNELTSYENTETTQAGFTVGPRWLGTGSAVWGRSQQQSELFEPIDTYQDAQRLMQRKRAVGGVIVKSYRQPARKQRQMLVKAGREAGIMVDAEGESHFYFGITMVLDGHTNLEHNLPVANYYDDLVQLMGGARAHNTPTLVVNFGELFGENYMYQTTQAWKEPKVQAYIQKSESGYSPLNSPYDSPPHVRGMTTIHAAEEIWDVGFRSVSRATKRLDDAGAVINVGSHGQVPGLAMHWEMALLAQGGMSNAHVLRAATLNPAKTLGMDDQLGSLEPGKLADIIVLDANPLQDIKNSNSVRYTMVNGRLYDSLSMNEIGNYDRPRTRFYWELNSREGQQWNEAWQGN